MPRTPRPAASLPVPGSPDEPAAHQPGPIRGWLALLCAALLVLHPLRFALDVGQWLSALGVRGLPLAAVLFVRLGVTALGVAAGSALWNRRPSAAALTRSALVLSAALDLFIYLTSYVPNNRAPGDTPFYIAGSLLYHAAWITYTLRSKAFPPMTR